MIEETFNKYQKMIVISVFRKLNKRNFSSTILIIEDKIQMI